MKKKGRAVKTINPISRTVLLPSNLDLDDLLHKHPISLSYTHNGDAVRIKNRLAIILDQIRKSRVFRKDTNGLENKGFTNLHSKILQNLVSNYNEYIIWLIKVNIIDCDNICIWGIKAKGYKYSSYYAECQDLKPYYIYESKLISNITKNNVHVAASQIHSSLFDDLKKITITSENKFNLLIPSLKQKALTAISEKFSTHRLKKGKKSIYNGYGGIMKELILTGILVNQKIQSWVYVIKSIIIKNWFFRRDTTSKRLHTNITGLKRELRQLLRFHGQVLTSIDICNSQPYMSLALFNSSVSSDIQNIIDAHISYLKTDYPVIYSKLKQHLALLQSSKKPKDANDYCQEVTSGALYDNLATRWSNKFNENISRAFAKEEVFNIFFQPTRYPNKYKTDFANLYPSVFTLIKYINHGFTHTKAQRKAIIKKYGSFSGQGNAWSCILQNIESHLVIDDICGSIKSSNNNIPLITVHDSLATTSQFVSKVDTTIKVRLKKAIGYAPSLKHEVWA